MNNNFLGIRGLYKTHMDGLKPFNSKSVTYTYIRYTEHNSCGQPIVRQCHKVYGGSSEFTPNNSIYFTRTAQLRVMALQEPTSLF